MFDTTIAVMIYLKTILLNKTVYIQ